MPRVSVRYWAAARAAAGVEHEDVEASGTAALRRALAERGGELARVVEHSSLLVDGVAARGDVPLAAGQVVEVLPPFAGG